jgi:superoxide dismutase
MLSKFFSVSSSFFFFTLLIALAITIINATEQQQQEHPTISLPPLNFGLGSLRPHFTHEQLNLHYNAHQSGYVSFLKSWFDSATGDAGKALQKLYANYKNEVRGAEIQFVQNTAASQVGDVSKRISFAKLTKLNQSFVTFLASSAGANLPQGSKHKNFAGQVYNHALYFSSMTEEPIQLAAFLNAYKSTSPLAVQIEKQFGTAENFLAAFETKATAHFGSGWIWLGLLKKNKNKENLLFIMDTHDAEVFHDKLRLQSEKKVTVTRFSVSASDSTKFVEESEEVEYDLDVDEIEPLFVMDVWEHAYYPDYRQKRADYVKNWFQVVDWQRIDRRFSSEPLNIEVRPHRLDDKERAKRLFNKKSESERAATEVNDAYPHFV